MTVQPSTTADVQAVDQLLKAHEAELTSQWMRTLKADAAYDSGRIRDAELQTQCSTFLRHLGGALSTGATALEGADFADMRELLSELSSSRALQGFSPRETAVFIFALKQPLLVMLQQQLGQDTAGVLQANWSIGQMLDQMALFTIETHQKTRESLIVRQQQEISELSTPVIKLWDGILALPLIGTLDSQRTQVVMENLLETIVKLGAEMAIIDITGVPTVDTLTAQHLLKTVAAARLMGADCIISGIRPQIAQTMVHLGVELTVVSKATLADAFALALARQGRTVSRVRQPAQAPAAASSGSPWLPRA